MGSGKTTLGLKLANELNIPFIDSDSEIEKQTNLTISQIFESKGEMEFRELESKFIDELSNRKFFVLSTGGGMPCFNSNIEKLNDLGLTFYLKNSSETLAKRIQNSENERPLTKNKSHDELILFIEENLKKRESFYKKAKFTLLPEEQMVEKIIQNYLSEK
jgi:shikimate kinase